MKAQIAKLFAAAMVLGFAIPALAQPTISWVLTYENRSTNQFAHDARTASLVNTTVPAKLAPLVLDALGGPPDPVFVREHRYLSASACVPHACTSKGFFWIDTQTGAGLGAQLEEAGRSGSPALTIGSNALSATAMPTAAREALVAWIADTGLTPERATFMNAGGVTASIDPLPFTVTRFTPPRTGPSFDCAKAATAIERAICGDWEVSGLDLQLFEIYEKGRLGLDTVPAREELRTLQRDWLKARDTDCAPSADIIACVRRYYRQQIDVLLRWTPSR